jgi:O-antigen/teichoic acid export membrane protein
MSDKRKVLENSFLYTFSSLLVKAVGFLLLPIYTIFLSPEDYGITNLVTSFTEVATFIISFSLYSGVIRIYADYKENKEILKRLFGTVIIFISLSSVIFISIGLIFKNVLVLWLFEGVSFFPIVFIALLTLIFVSLHTMHQSILQAMQQGKKLTKINLVVFGLQICLNLVFIGAFKLGAVGMLLAQLIISVGYFLYMLIDLKVNNLITFRVDIKLLKESLKYSIPLMPHNLSTRIANFASRIFINNGGSIALVGLYSVASQFSLIIDIVQTSVNNAFQPWFFNMMRNKTNEGRVEVVKLSRFLLLIYSLIYLLIGLFSQEVIILLTNERYVLAWTVIPILVIGFSVKSIYYFYVNILFYYKKAARKIFISTITGSLTDIILAFILIPMYGMYGAALSFLFAKIIVVIIVVIISRKYDDIGYSLTGMIRIIVPSLIFLGIGLYFSYTKYMTIFSWNNVLFKISIMFAYLLFVYFTNRTIVNSIINSGKIQDLLGGKFTRNLKKL